jgi:BirA family transcriptional regulator, biotin operon repressor / biotin---[acetyl-CoA-carboxylase] ligase
MVGVMSTENDPPAPAPAPGPAEAPARPPLDPTALRTSLIRPGGLWRDITVLESTGSTNADLVARVAAGAPEGTVLAAEEQRQGRGRMGRRWVSPPRAALMVSVLLRPASVPPAGVLPASVPPARRGWLPLLAGVAAATAVRRVAGVPAVLKWPNDLLVGERKLAGILAEQSGDAIVVGIGLNVSTTRDEFRDTGPGALPATSLLLEGATSLDRTALLTGLLGQLDHWYGAWRGTVPPGDPEHSGLRQAYLDLSVTIGRDVRVERPAGNVTAGRATGLDPDGRLIVAGPDGDEAVSAGDVRHLR